MKHRIDGEILLILLDTGRQAFSLRLVLVVINLTHLNMQEKSKSAADKITIEGIPGARK